MNLENMINWIFVIGMNILTFGLISLYTIKLIKTNSQMRLALGIDKNGI